MTRIKDLSKIATGSPVSPGSGGGDFIAQVRGTIREFQNLLKMAQELKGLTGADSPGPEPQPDTNPEPPLKSLPPVNPPGLTVPQLVQLLIDQGFGDVPLGELIKRVSPFTLKQLKEFADAGLKK